MSSKTAASGLQGRASGRAGRWRGQRNELGTASAPGSHIFWSGRRESPLAPLAQSAAALRALRTSLANARAFAQLRTRNRVRFPARATKTSPAPHPHRARTFSGAGDGNRTRVISLEGWGSTIELRPHMVGTTGFEPAASCSQSTRATRLRHVPTSGLALYGF